MLISQLLQVNIFLDSALALPGEPPVSRLEFANGRRKPLKLLPDALLDGEGDQRRQRLAYSALPISYSISALNL